MPLRPLPPVLAIVALVLAGCLGGEVAPAAGSEPAIAAPPLPTELVEPVLAPLALLGIGPGEPNIIVAPDGTVYVAAVNDIYRSTDGGATYELVAAGLDGGGDGDIVVTPSGRVHWLGLGGRNGPIPYTFSDDQGETWSKQVDLSNETGNDREWMDARLDEPTLYTAWRDGDDGGIVAFRASFDDGATWTERVKMSDDAVGGPIAHGPRPGQVYQAQAVFESQLGAQDASLRLARSADHGATWELLPVLTPAQGPQFGLIGFPFSIFPVVAVDDAGTLYLVYAVDQETIPGAPKPLARYGVYLQVSKDEGATWSEPQLVSAPDRAAIMPWIVAGAPGRIAMVWYQNTYGNPHDNLPDVWNVELVEMIGLDGDAPQTVRARLNDAPVHLGSICTSGVGCYLSAGDRSLLDFLEVALTPEGHPIATWSATDHPYQGMLGVTLDLGGVRIYARGVESGTPLR